MEVLESTVRKFVKQQVKVKKHQVRFSLAMYQVLLPRMSSTSLT